MNLHESHFKPEDLDPAEPEISADQVVDRRTLKKFVNGAIDYLFGLDSASAIGIARSVLRRPPWKRGPVYLFVMDPNGFTHLHAGFPDKFEFQEPTETLRDEITGELILPQVIAAAQKEGGGFVQYYFDDPADHSDSADVSKVTYARQVEFPLNIPGVPPIKYIVGAGIYGDPVSQESVAGAKGWLARFGRAVASQSVEMIQGRMNAPAPSGAKMTLGGQSVNLGVDAARSPTTDGAGFDLASLVQNGGDSGGLAQWRGTDRLTLGGNGSPGTYRGMTMSDFLARSSFHLASAKGVAGEAGGRWSAWGGGARTSFEGGGAAAIDGDVTTGILGVDYEKGQLLGGVALSRASGEGGFENEGRSEMEATLTSVHPYLRYTVSERFSMWGILGLGRGEMTLDEKVIEKRVETDIEMRMGAFGIRGALAQMGGFDLALKSDALLAQVDADEKGDLEAISADASRFRVMIEASREMATGGGGMFKPLVEAGVRHDGGDVDEGMGVEVGGSLRFTSPGTGFSMELRARGLVTHAEEDVADWGVGGMIRIDPGQVGRGIALSVQPAVGDTVGGAAHLWGLRDASRLANGEIEDLDPRVRGEVGYGMDAWGGLLTPYAGLSLSEQGRETYRVGGRFRMGESLTMSLEGDMRERVNDDPAHGLILRGSVRW